eukprot:CAMPEP_0204496848 /NCGR_PEP_ID=MMETSP0471-20130131/89586_1 /ASSEMBLY_ACC=CAM_ASM_000602 /TAXON_ID=2969 /ORGANISM="Oxyrrhis marina" /LENGTH=53 /DNA_ID=CAMNT_0051501209 /DNA_START=45 /DNA_END=202 /DNA_ORIENTATION=-
MSAMSGKVAASEPVKANDVAMANAPRGPSQEVPPAQGSSNPVPFFGKQTDQTA